MSALELQHIVARRLLRLRGAVVIERPHRRIAPDDVAGDHRLVEIFAGGGAEIVGLLFGDPHVLRIAAVIAIGGADQREILLIGNGEDDAVVGVLEEIGARPLELLLDDDVAALHQPHMPGLGLAEALRAAPDRPRGRRH